MRTLFVTGPGGAGSSTVAAATALALADAGRPVTLLTAAVPAVPDLGPAVDVRVVSPVAALGPAWAGHADALAALVPALTLPPSSSVVPVPGVAEVALLAALGELAGSTDVVVDAGPLEQAVDLLALPHAARWWTAQLAPPRLRVLASVRSLARARPGVVEAAVAAVESLESAVRRLPTDPEVHLVLPPDPRALPALRRAAVGLGVLGHALASVTLARVLPPAAGEWARSRTVQQDAVRTALRTAGVSAPEVAEAPTSPTDAAALRALGAAVPTGDAATTTTTTTPRRAGSGWELAVPLPFVGRGEVDLTRWGDELVIGAAGRRRSWSLDPLLRRCTVTGASVAEPGTPQAALVVRFAPDPAQWPADLLAAEAAR